jgi:outer membrane protein assembly complex protein YaeT
MSRQVTAARQRAFRRIQALTLNSSSLFRKYVFSLVAALIFFGVVRAPNSLAASWTMSGDLPLSKEDAARIKLRTPEINDIADLQIVLNSITLRHPFTALWVERDDSGFIFRGKPGRPVSKIDFKMAPLSLLPHLRSVSSPFAGQVHSQQILDKISRDIRAILARQGYQNGSVKNVVTEGDEGFEYIFTLDIGEPCIIRGYKWKSPSPVKIDQSLKIGDICDIDEAAKTVSETESRARAAGYAEANVAFDGFQFDAGSKSAWVLVSGSFGNKIVYDFIDQTTGRKLSSVFTNTDMQAFDPSILSPESVNFELIRQLKKRGYSNAQITDTEIVKSEKGETIHRYTVLLGENTVITRLQIEGNNAFSENEIFNLLGIERPTQLEGRSSDVVYNPDAISAGVENLRAFYINRGYWDVKIIDRQIQSQSREGQMGHVVVAISIEEGDQRVFDHVDFSGNASITSAELLELSTFSNAEPLDRSKIVTLQQKVRSYYAAKGYFYTSTSGETVSRSRGNGVIDVTVSILVEEGPRVKFGDIFITGLVKTHPKVVMRELYFETGDWYDPELLSATRKALLRIGAFSTVVISPLDPDLAFKRSEMVDLVIQVTESPSRTVTFGPGWSSFYGMRYNVEGALTNIGGNGRQLYGRASFNEEAQQKAIGPRTLVGRAISAGYLEPHILDGPLDATLALSQAARATEYAWSLTRSGEIELSHSLKSVVPGSKISTFYSRKLNAEEGAREDVDAFLADTFALGRSGFRFMIDKRNDVTWASEGFTLGSELAWARYDFGGDLRYFRWDVTNNHYFSPLENLVFAFGLNFTSYEDVERQGHMNGDVLPASERLPAGGADTIRGFKERNLGPMVRRPSLNADNQWDCGYTASPTGGSRRLILKAETRYRFTPSLAGTIFIDSGTSSFSKKEIHKFDRAFTSAAAPVNAPGCTGTADKKSIEDNNGYELGDVASDPKIIWNKNYSSAGTAINFLTPIGSINLAYGIPWHEPKSSDCAKNSAKCYPRSDTTIPLWKRGEVHFNVGAKF